MLARNSATQTRFRRPASDPYCSPNSIFYIRYAYTLRYATTALLKLARRLNRDNTLYCRKRDCNRDRRVLKTNHDPRFTVLRIDGLHNASLAFIV